MNHYWGARGNRRFIKADGLAFQQLVIAEARRQCIRPFTKSQRVSVKIMAYPPDRRRRDIDNLLKAACDSMVHAKLLHDDCQIDDLRIVRGDVEKDGRLLVHIEELLPSVAGGSK